MKDLRSLTLEEITEYMKTIGEKGFRAKQVYDWVSKGVSTFDEMTNLSQSLIEQMKRDFRLDNFKIIQTLKSEDGTIKVLGALWDDNIVESVFMTYKHGNSVCVSTQVGCKMKCTFCASTLGGVVRNLTSGEILGQIYALQNMTGERVNNVVLMGSGEPLDNYDETLRFIKLSTDEKGLNLSGRNITLSTCGLATEIRKLAEERLQITLAISLHNPIEDERLQIMPITKKHSLSDLMSSVDYYIEMTGRRVTFEYALIDGVNDTERHAKALGALLKGKLVHVNLIPVNAVVENNFLPSSNNKINGFKRVLMDKYRLNTTVRRELGSDINAACGQLRNQHL
ncbi:MAG: 23S rRNA (adenine(2503)-C(2))-methyltransferase RlmN [Clostridiales bacterium]|nr:23S rRNA (adenine(2503)-C(2))-methyltransferase RlmN [Clostridiales bacterium]